MHETLIAAVVGHAHRTMTSRCGSGYSNAALAEAVAKIKYPEVKEVN